MTVKRFREVRRGYISQATNDALWPINVRLEGSPGLGFTDTQRGVLFMEVLLLAVSPFNVSASGCMIRRCVFNNLGTGGWLIHPELDHRSVTPAGSLGNFIGIRTTPFPVGVPVLAGVVNGNGSYPIRFINFEVAGSAGSRRAQALYELLTPSNIHYQITMEGFEDTTPWS